MRRETVMGKKRRMYLLEQADFDYILEEYDTPDFHEMIISVGGDVSRLRCYGNDEDGFSIRVK